MVWKAFQHFDKDKTYLLYCMFGLQTSVIAQEMSKQGIDAYSFKGGTPALLRYTKQR